MTDSTAPSEVSSKDKKPEHEEEKQPEEQVIDPIAPAVQIIATDEKPSRDTEPEMTQALSAIAVQKEEDTCAVAEEKVDEKPVVEVASVVVKSSNARSVTASKPATTTKQPVGGGGAVGRSQIPKASASKSNEPSASTKVAITDAARAPPIKSVSSSTAVKSRSSMAVVGRAKTVELSKSVAVKKMSVGELQAPRVVRQMSTGQMQPQSPSRVIPVKMNARLKSAETSPVKKTSTANSNKTEETKKSATTTGLS